MKKEEILKKARERWAASNAASQDNRDSYSNDTKFEDGDQWSDDDLAQRKGRPCIVINKVAGAVKQITGDARRNRPSVKVRPVDSKSDIAVAQLFTSLIRNIENTSDAESAYDTGFECAVRGGIGYWRIITDYVDDAAFEQEIRIERVVNPMSVYMDEGAVKTDYSDAEYAFVCETIPEEKFKEKYPKARIGDWERGTGEEKSDWFTDSTVRVAEYFYKEKYETELFELTDGKTVELKKPSKETVESPAQTESGSRTVKYVYGEGLSQPLEYVKSRKVKKTRVMWCKMTATEILDGPTEWAGKYIPIIPCVGEEVWIDGERVLRSAIRHAIDAQKLYNWSRSNTIETLAMAPKQPYLVTPAEIEGHERQWNEAHLKPQAYRLYNDVGLGRPQPSTPSIPNTGAYKEAMVAADDIKATTNIFDASLGAQGNETSGRAIMERKQQGSTASFVFVDNQARAIRYTGKVLVDLIPKIYDSERVVRLLNEDGSEGWQIINKYDPITKKTFNDLSVGRYDVVFDAGPSYLTRRIEAADGLMKVAQTAPQFLPILMPDIAKNLDWPGAQELGQKLQETSKPKGPPPELQAKLELEKIKGQTLQAKAQADIQGKQVDLEAKKADFKAKQLDIQSKSIDLQIKQLELGYAKQDMEGRRIDLKGKDLMVQGKALDNAIKTTNLVTSMTGQKSPTGSTESRK